MCETRCSHVFDTPLKQAASSPILTIRNSTNGETADFILPRIMARGKKDLTDLFSKDKIQDFEYMFNRTHFIDSFSLACPQMRIYPDIDDFLSSSWISKTVKLDVGNLVPGSLRQNWVQNPELWSPYFVDWLTNK